jgi:putative flippase GtrA
VDDPDSRVDIVSTAIADLKGIARLTRALGSGRVPVAALRDQLGRTPLPVARVPAGLTGQLIRFATIGVASTLAYLSLYAVQRLGLSPLAANFVALLLTAVANTAANRRLTFGVRGRTGLLRQHALGAVVFALTLGLTSGALAVMYALDPTPARPVELAVLIAASSAATVTRYLALRAWVFVRAPQAVVS